MKTCTCSFQLGAASECAEGQKLEESCRELNEIWMRTREKGEEYNTAWWAWSLHCSPYPGEENA